MSVSKNSALKPKDSISGKALTSNEKAQAKSATILRGAIEVFARVGYFNAKVTEVAHAAGVADGTVYLYFKNKDDLLVSIFNTAMEAFNARASKELAELSDPREQLRHFARLHFESLEADEALAVEIGRAHV